MPASSGTSSSPATTTTLSSGAPPPGSSTCTPSKGALNMLPNVLPHTEADHVPVLADEVRELLAVQPGETVVDATFGAGGHARLLAGDLAGRGKLVAIDRDPTVKPYLDRVRAQAGADIRFLRGDFALVLAQLAANGVGADAV